MEPYNQQQYWDANVRPPAQQQQQSAHHPSPSHQPLAQHPPPPPPTYYYGGDQQQYWNANMWPPAQQQQQLTHHPPPSHQQLAQYPPPPRPPYFYGGSQQQYWDANMWPPAQQQQPLGHYPPPSYQQSAQYPPPPRQPYHYGGGAAGTVGGADEVRTLYIGRLQDWMDEDYLNSYFGQTGQLVSAKIIRNKQTGQSEGYGFLEFSSSAAAENIMQSFNGKQSFKLNWAGRSAETFNIFVGNLDVTVTDHVLLETFKSEYPSVKSANVIRDRVAGHSKGCGFVRFGDETERDRSILQMNGRRISNLPIRIEHASGKTPSSAQPQNASHQNPQGTSDLNNSRIFVSDLHLKATSEDLQRSFSRFGRVAFAEAQPGCCHGYVQFSDRESRSSAELAMTSSYRNSIEILGKTVRLQWWRSTAERQKQSGPSQSGYSRGY